jgi:hypothetical protein
VDEIVQGELAELRRRVYGPDGDLYGDRDAAARLSVLEGQETARNAGEASPDLTVTEAVTDEKTDSSEAVSRYPRLGKRTKFLWAASVVATALITAAGSALMHAPPGSQVMTLPLHAEEEAPTAQTNYPEGALITDDFHGLTVMYLRPDEASSVPDGGCLQVAPTVYDPRLSPTFGCGAGPFPPSAPLTINQTSPRELQQAFSIGTTLQFTMQDGVVHVRSD